jgi:predicted SAM-dependent methyltransferase
VKLNIGSGTHPSSGLAVDHEEWVDVDLPWDGVISPHIYAVVFALPFPTGVFDAAYLGHVLEHLAREAVSDALSEIRRTMKPGAQLVIVGPASDLAVTTGQPDWLLRDIDTLKAGPGGHKWVATEALTLEVVRSVFVDARLVDVVEVDVPEWPNASTAAWQCALVATA